MSLAREPLAVRAAVVALVTAIVHAAVVFGLVHWSAEQETTLGGLIDLAGLVVALIWARSAVTPVDAPRDAEGRRLVPAPGLRRAAPTDPPDRTTLG